MELVLPVPDLLMWIDYSSEKMYYLKAYNISNHFVWFSLQGVDMGYKTLKQALPNLFGYVRAI